MWSEAPPRPGVVVGPPLDVVRGPTSGAGRWPNLEEVEVGPEEEQE